MNKFLKNWFQKSKIHILVWLVFIVYETVIIGLISGVYGDPLTYLFYYAVNISLFYFHAKVGLPLAIKSNKLVLVKIFFLTLLEIGSYVLVIFLVNVLLQHASLKAYSTFLNFHQQFSLKALFRCLYFMGFATGYYFLQTYLEEKQRSDELERLSLNNLLQREVAEKELSLARNAFLKAQINPHFLFNTLDFIYQKVDIIDSEASIAVIKLAQMMRFALDTDLKDEFIELGEEIMQVENLIDLNRIRKKNGVNISFNYTQEVLTTKAIPLILLTLGENIFKHGNLSSPDHPATIDLYVNDGLLYVETINLKNQYPPLNSHHSGLENIMKRIQHAYGEAVEFSHYTDERNYFRLKLVLPQTQYLG